MAMPDSVKLMGLWKNKDRNGNTYLAGGLGPTARVLVLPNTRKKESKEPDYHVFIARRSRKEEIPPDTGEPDSKVGGE